MKAVDFRKKTKPELHKELITKKQELEQLVRDVMREKEKNTSKVKLIRKDIARIQTVLQETNG